MSTRATRRWAAILFSLLFVGLGTGVRGQPTHRLSGIVRTTSDRPLAGATVRIEGSTVSAQADAAGAYRLSVAEGEVTLRVSHRAYQDATRTVTVDGDRQEDFQLDALYRVSESVVVQAVRADALAPVSRTDLGPDEIAERNHGQEMPFLLSSTPSVTAYSDTGLGAGYSYLYLRGVQQTRLNMTLDGVPLNEPEDSAVYFADFGDFTSSLESIQVQRGVGTSTFGAAAYGGSINFESVDLQEQRQALASLGAGSFGTYRASLGLQSGRVGPGLAFYGRGSYQETEGFREHSGIRQRSLFFGASRQGERSFFKLFGFVGREITQLAFLATEKDVLEQDLRFNPMATDEIDRFGEDFVQAQLTRSLGASSSLSVQAYTVGAGGDYRIRDTWGTGELLQYDLDWRFSGGRVSFQHARGRASLTLGAHAYDYESRHRGGVAFEPLDYTNHGHKKEASAFAKLTYDMGALHTYGDAQLRWARFRYEGDVPVGEKDWTFFNPKLGLRYDLGPGLSVYTSVGRTTREPARSDLLAGEDNATVPHDLGAVQPERVTSAELGLDYRRSELSLKANLYLMEFRNEIALTGELSEIGLPLRRNVDRSHRRGLELNATCQAAPRLRLWAAANLSTNRIGEWVQFYDVYDADGSFVDSVSRSHPDVPPLLTPEAVANFGFDWSPRTWLGLSAAGRYVAESHLDNTGSENFVTPSFFGLDATLRLSLDGLVHRGSPVLRLSVTNLLDNDRMFPSGYSYQYLVRGPDGAESLAGTSYYYPLATRSVVATLDLRF